MKHWALRDESIDTTLDSTVILVHYIRLWRAISMRVTERKSIHLTGRTNGGFDLGPQYHRIRFLNG